MKKLFIALLLMLMVLSCRRWFHKECRSNYQINNGEIVAALVYNCLVFDPDAKGDTTAYTRQGQWDTLWINLAAKYGNGCPKPTIDFSQNSVLTYYQTYTTGYKILRDVSRDDNAKTITYTITRFKCSSGNDNTLGENMVVIPKIPDGYKVIWKTAVE